MNKKEKLWERQHQSLRKPSEIFGGDYVTSGINNVTLDFQADAAFESLLRKLKVTLIISREYENLLIALRPQKKGIAQSFFHLPHPSGLVVDRAKSKMYVAATRNPNQIIE